MQLLQLYYFKLLAENEHLLNTAKQIHISPPALSSTISKLENELNTKLFDRTGRTLKLNDKGKVIYMHVCNIFYELDKIESELKDKPPHERNIIRVGVTAMSLWNETLGNFMKENPNTIVRHSILRHEQIADKEYLDNFDLILTGINDLTCRAWESRMILEDPPVLLVNKNHPFAQRPRMALFETRNEPFIALTKGYFSRAWFDESCKKAGFEPHIVAEVDYMLRTRLIENGAGIAFSSVFGASVLNSESIRTVRLNADTSPRIQSVFYKKGKVLSPDAENLKDYLISYFHSKQEEYL